MGYSQIHGYGCTIVRNAPMVLICPKCNSRDVRLSRKKGALRNLLNFLGIYNFRCEACDHGFRSNINRIAMVVYAKCPTCHRMDLSRWMLEYYSPGWWTRAMLTAGAKPVRCEYCRHNFWSFRFIRERFSKQKRSARSLIVNPVDSDGEDGGPLLRPVNRAKLRQANTVTPVSAPSHPAGTRFLCSSQKASRC